MRRLRALALLSVCFLDVHVRAEGPVLNAEAGRATFTIEKSKLVLATGALAHQGSGPTVRLLKGRALVTGSMTLTTPFAKLSCEGACEALFTREDQSIAIETLSEGWIIQRTGDAQEMSVGPALRVVIGTVARDGRAQVSAAETLPWASLITRWAALYVDGAEAFTERVHHFRPTWEHAVENLSESQRHRSLAMVDQAQAEANRRAARQKAAADEDEHLRRLFREKNFVD